MKRAIKSARGAMKRASNKRKDHGACHEASRKMSKEPSSEAHNKVSSRASDGVSKKASNNYMKLRIAQVPARSRFSSVCFLLALISLSFSACSAS